MLVKRICRLAAALAAVMACGAVPGGATVGWTPQGRIDITFPAASLPISYVATATVTVSGTGTAVNVRVTGPEGSTIDPSTFTLADGASREISASMPATAGTYTWTATVTGPAGQARLQGEGAAMAAEGPVGRANVNAAAVQFNKELVVSRLCYADEWVPLADPFDVSVAPAAAFDDLELVADHGGQVFRFSTWEQDGVKWGTYRLKPNEGFSSDPARPGGDIVIAANIAGHVQNQTRAVVLRPATVTETEPQQPLQVVHQNTANQTGGETELASDVHANVTLRFQDQYHTQLDHAWDGGQKVYELILGLGQGGGWVAPTLAGNIALPDGLLDGGLMRDQCGNGRIVPVWPPLTQAQVNAWTGLVYSLDGFNTTLGSMPGFIRYEQALSVWGTDVTPAYVRRHDIGAVWAVPGVASPFSMHVE